MQKPLEIGLAKRAGRFPLNSNILKGRREWGRQEGMKKRQRRKRLNVGDTRSWRDRKQWQSVHLNLTAWLRVPVKVLLLVLCSNTLLNLKNTSTVVRDSAGWWSTLLHCCFSYTLCDITLYGKTSRHHYHLREPVSNLTLIKTQSIAHYAIAIDRRELEVRLIDERHSQTITQTTILSPLSHLTIPTVFSIPAW